ncbi:MAG: TlpA family protein disulfide reductase [Clostridia bacterium]|nr:TlpA family protein disulfide reductase [Clostridia bacterium]
MKKFKLFFKSALIAVLSLAFALPLVACDDGNTPDDGTDGTVLSANVIYVKSYGGVALTGVTVELYSGTEKVLEAKTTDDEGKVAYDLPDGTYRASLSDLPAGYYEGGENPAPRTVKSSDKETTLYVASKVITEGYPSKQYVTGDVMYDFEQTVYTYNPDSKAQYDSYTVKLSELLEDKKAVVLNFWYASCYWCNEEYPAMANAYLQYADDIEILAINDYYDDTAQTVVAKVISDEVPYLMCKDNASIGAWIAKSGYPTSAMIDRYGVITEITTTQTEEKFWTDWFAKYTADNYVPNFTAGNTADDDTDYVADKPEDFGVKMPSSQELNKNTSINNTGKTLVFSEDTTTNYDGGKSAWPWDLSADGTALYPTNSTHGKTAGIIYVSLELDENQVLAFDYKVSSQYGYDNFYVAVDARNGLGKQTLVDFGVKDWQTGYAYVALEKGTHEIAFVYARTSTTSAEELAINGIEDNVYVRNLRLISVNELNAELIKNGETLEIAYPAMREYNYDTWMYDYVDGVYLASDGYYHVGDKNNPNAKDPYLFAAMSHTTPYFGTATSTLSTYYSEQINKRGSVILNGIDCTARFQSYILYSTNSAYTGMVPVTEDLKKLLTEFCRNDGVTDNDAWLLLCLSFRQYGVQKDLQDPVKGLAYFSAFGDIKINYTEADNNVNTATFDTVVMPRGYVYEFTPTQDGVYRIHGLDVYDDKNVKLETDAWLFDDTMKVHHALATEIAESGQDRFVRSGDETNFDIYHYLHANRTYYLTVAFRVVETLGSIDFRIDRIGDSYDYLAPATANFYVASGSVLTLPVYADVEYDEALGYYVDKASNRPIYVDLTEPTFLFDKYTISEVLDENINSYQLNFDLTTHTVLDPDDPEGKATMEVPLIVTIDGKELVGEDFTQVMKDYLAEVTPDCASFAGTIDGKPVTLTMNREYLTVNYDGQSKKVLINANSMKMERGQNVSVEIGDITFTINLKLNADEDKVTAEATYTLPDSETSTTLLLDEHDYVYDIDSYGLHVVDEQLYKILQLYNYKFAGFDDSNEWLRACWYWVHVGV